MGHRSHDNQTRLHRSYQQVVDDDDSESASSNEQTYEPLVKVLDAIATQDAWNPVLTAYVCPVAECERTFRKLGHLNQHLASITHRCDPSTFHCPKCAITFPVVSALTQHLESGSCGIAGQEQVKEIYTGLHDMFKRLLRF